MNKKTLYDNIVSNLNGSKDLKSAINAASNENLQIALDAFRFEIKKIAENNGCPDMKAFGDLWKDEKSDLTAASWIDFLEMLNGGDDVESMMEEALMDIHDAGVIDDEPDYEDCLKACRKNKAVMKNFQKEILSEMFD